MSSPTQRSKEYLESQGYLVAIVERWNPFAKVRQDLFGFIDLLAVREGETVAVQTTSRSNMSARARKIAEHQNTAAVRKAGWQIVIHGWAKDTKGRWGVKVQDVS
ncbi:hypothetical protein NDR89_23210 [Cupriavidus gilardii]|uniref:Uncharacterized protein n=1 Tax=Cupriavidus gilardii TaxID=82541 RepID=A0ABY4VR65_9BURK|nr:hypothetical protein [Cupriavidus gilardii]USE79503.1 hypothetical protein NDR89_23210 [Cupriavidus gilardii]